MNDKQFEEFINTIKNSAAAIVIAIITLGIAIVITMDYCTKNSLHLP